MYVDRTGSVLFGRVSVISTYFGKTAAPFAAAQACGDQVIVVAVDVEIVTLRGNLYENNSRLHCSDADAQKGIPSSQTLSWN